MKFDKFFEFLCELIASQIKKYLALAKIGVGPDAGINSYLVLQQVKVLLDLADKLLIEINKNERNQDISKIISIAQPIYFFLKLEKMRATAAWLIDENNIHNGVYERNAEQIKSFNDILNSFNIRERIESQPAQNNFQKQIEYDSYAIALLILQAAVTIKNNPNADLGAEIPEHAMIILRKHAQPEGRYFNQDIWPQIEKLYQECDIYLQGSQLKKSVVKLSKTDAEKQSTVDKQHLKKLLEKFKALYPESPLFLPGNLYDTFMADKSSNAIIKTSQNAWYHSRYLFFAGAALVIGNLAYYLCQNFYDDPNCVAKLMK